MMIINTVPLTAMKPVRDFLYCNDMRQTNMSAKMRMYETFLLGGGA